MQYSTKLKNKTRDEIIQHVIDRVCQRINCDGFTTEDLAQEAWCIVLELLDKDLYDPAQPLEGYLYRGLRNRLLNFAREQSNAKRQIPNNLESDDLALWETAHYTDSVDYQLRYDEALSKLKGGLPPEMRQELRRVLDGENIGSARLSNLRNAIDGEHPTKYYGISYNKKNKRWIASISVKNKNNYIGCFLDKESAARAYDNYVKQHKLNRPLNFPSN